MTHVKSVRLYLYIVQSIAENREHRHWLISSRRRGRNLEQCLTRRRKRSTEMQRDPLKSKVMIHKGLLMYSFYDNPPSQFASRNKKKRVDDDTPKSFLRLVNRKSRKELIAEGKIKPTRGPELKIEPGESLHEFRQFFRI